MSGHMTMTSRGSRVGSSARTCRSASRRTSTWRARPWQEWTMRLGASGAGGGRGAAAWGGVRRAVVGVIGRCAVVPDGGLDASEERLGLGERALMVLIGVWRIGRREDD